MSLIKKLFGFQANSPTERRGFLREALGDVKHISEAGMLVLAASCASQSHKRAGYLGPAELFDCKNTSTMIELEKLVYQKATPISQGVREIHRDVKNGFRFTARFLEDDLALKKMELIVEDRFQGANKEVARYIDSNLNGETNNPTVERTKYFRKSMEQLAAHLANQNGIIAPIALGDLGITCPNELPYAGILNWQEVQEGLEVTSMDVIMYGEIVDRFQFARYDPELFKTSMHKDINLKTMRKVEDWRKHLGAVVVINGSYYEAEPYGEPHVPMKFDGKSYNLTKGKSKIQGAFVAGPTKKGLSSVGFVDIKDVEKFDVDETGYNWVMSSYPTLLDFNGEVRRRAPEFDKPTWRASRTFVGMDDKGKVLMANTEGGFFSLYRLGRFLQTQQDELHLRYCLNLDGGPPSSMSIKSNKFEYLNQGMWEVNDMLGVEWWSSHNGTYRRWPIPIVIGVTPKNEE